VGGGPEEGLGGTLAHKIRSSLTYYRDIAAAGDCEIRLHGCTLYASLFRYDNDILVNPHAWGEPGFGQPHPAPAQARRRPGRRPLHEQLRTSMGHGQTVARRGNLMATGRTEYLNDPEAPNPNSLVPAAGVLAVDPDGRVLLQRRRDTGQWAIPMGKQEIGETVTQCAERETHEVAGGQVLLVNRASWVEPTVLRRSRFPSHGHESPLLVCLLVSVGRSSSPVGQLARQALTVLRLSTLLAAAGILAPGMSASYQELSIAGPVRSRSGSQHEGSHRPVRRWSRIKDGCGGGGIRLAVRRSPLRPAAVRRSRRAAPRQP